MATPLGRQPSLEFDVKVVRVAGVEAQLEGELFVRYYVPAGDGRRRIRVDTREVPCGTGGDDVFWGECVRFQLAGNGRAVAAPGKVAFELRWRPRPWSSGLATFLRSGGRHCACWREPCSPCRWTRNRRRRRTR
ncbi:hypothetical protein ZWY2020_008427 [Hordeum vulgare]|nr:hypothetical protein ZWY2020_008427 [Hordeum vulgare]